MNFSYFIDDGLVLDSSILDLLSSYTKNIFSIMENILLFNVLNLKNKDIFVYIVATNVILDLKYRFWGIHESSDVLTFPYTEMRFVPELDCIECQENIDKMPMGVPFSEIYISLEIAKKQSFEMGHSLKKELLILLVHGFLHSLGFDHERTKYEAAEMYRYESLILEQLGVNLLPLTVINDTKGVI